MMITTDLNAKRFAGKPLKQPSYSFKAIPKCNKNLEGSTLEEVTDRHHLNDAMAEMVLLCNETMRRQHVTGKRTSKPLSLEYIADRLDIDDPMFGYIVRTNTGDGEHWKRGMLQGFVTVTTFTNWQKTFRWDSLHDSAFAYDDKKLASQMLSGERSYDHDGSLAQALQSTVRCGDPWNEGIVWPRIAEISLLGAMGCGKALVSLAIEKLERMKATQKLNYDYVVLQATDNSIPFYESLGFVRVGGIIEDEKYEEKRGEPRPSKESLKSSSPSSMTGEIVSSPITAYVTQKPGETPAEIAKAFGVDIWDIIFLNHYIYADINSRSRLMQNTKLYVPAMEHVEAEATSLATEHRDLAAASAPQWYIAIENDTPRLIAKKFNVDCSELVAANRDRLPELQGISRLKEGTRIKVSHFHVHDDKHVPYCHWSFPDDSFETMDPSYMMVRKLNRRKGVSANVKPIEASLAVPVQKYTPPPSDLFHSIKPTPVETKTTKRSTATTVARSAEPKKPKRPLSGYMLFCQEQRDAFEEELKGKPGAEVMKLLSEMWNELPDSDKDLYQQEASKSQALYQKEIDKYKKDLVSFHQSHPELRPSVGADDFSRKLFNMVVKLNAQGLAQTHSEYEYFFVLTYIPDLQWVHLAPMVPVGYWGPDKSEAEGRPIWMLVREGEGKEVDISSAFCIPVRSRSMKGTADADREQWDIVDHAGKPTQLSPMSTSLARDFQQLKRKRGGPRKHPLSENQSQGGMSEPKKRGRPRKHPLPTAAAAEPKKNRGRPRKNPLPPESPLATPAVEPKKEWGLPRKYPQSEPKRKPGRPCKHPTPESTALQPLSEPNPKYASPPIEKLESLSGDAAWEPDERLSRYPKRKLYSARKPLNRAIQPKKRGRPRKYPRPADAPTPDTNSTRTVTKEGTKGVNKTRKHGKPVNGVTRPITEGKIKSSCKFPSTAEVPAPDTKTPGQMAVLSKTKRGRSRKHPLSEGSTGELTVNAMSPPTKRRKIPKRQAAPVFGSSPGDEDDELPKVERTLEDQAHRSSRGKQSVFRSVALTRSAKKVCTTSPLMFSPRATVHA